MLTKESIPKFYEDVEALGLRYPVAAISKATGYQKGTVSTYLSKKDEPSANFLTVFYEKFGESIKKVPRETNVKQKQSEALAINPEQHGDDVLRVLVNLSESHRNLTAAHKEISESNNKLADNERVLLNKMTTVGGGSETDIVEAAILVPLVDILSDLYTGNKKYGSKREAAVELGMKLGLHKPGRVKLKGTPSDGGK